MPAFALPHLETCTPQKYIEEGETLLTMLQDGCMSANIFGYCTQETINANLYLGQDKNYCNGHSN
jgi:hypothetical protein